jgi:hypothetical protein
MGVHTIAAIAITATVTIMIGIMAGIVIIRAPTTGAPAAA